MLPHLAVASPETGITAGSVVLKEGWHEEWRIVEVTACNSDEVSSHHAHLQLR
jgi:hypothetical protein